MIIDEWSCTFCGNKALKYINLYKPIYICNDCEDIIQGFKPDTHNIKDKFDKLAGRTHDN